MNRYIYSTIILVVVVLFLILVIILFNLKKTTEAEKVCRTVVETLNSWDVQ